MRGKVKTIFEQDRRLLTHLFRVRLSTIYQLLRDCPFYTKRENLSRRLNQLALSGYIEKG